MELKFLHNTNIDFISKRYIFFAISVIMALAGVVSLVARKGPNYGIDFTGGILMQVSFAPQGSAVAPRSGVPSTGPVSAVDQRTAVAVNMDDVRSALGAAGLQGYELQSSLSSIIIRAKKSTINQEEFASNVTRALQQKFPDKRLVVERTEYVGPAVGKHLVKQAFFALVFSFIGIIIYVAFRFHSGIWGAAGVIGIMHDVFIIFGIFSILNKEITLTIIAALLTVAGYSINDTIVVFDRIRENLKLIVKEDFGSIINKSINQTLSRTIITSLTVFLVALSMFFLGGEVIHDFALALCIGVVVGTYSSVYVCTPLAFEWEANKKRKLAAMSGKQLKR